MKRIGDVVDLIALYVQWLKILTLPTMVFLEQPKIFGAGGGHNVLPISYACSICAILLKLWEIKQLDK